MGRAEFSSPAGDQFHGLPTIPGESGSVADPSSGDGMDWSGQHEQFAERFVRSQDRIYAYVVTLLPNRTDAEEVFQQTSLVLWKKWQQFDPSRDFVAWACGIAHHEVQNFLRKHRDKGRVALSEDMLAAGPGSAGTGRCAGSAPAGAVPLPGSA